MITLQDLNVICINPFQIMPNNDKNLDFLATTRTIYNNAQSGGIRIKLKFGIKNISDGYLTFTQLVTDHEIKIKNNTDSYTFSSQNLDCKFYDKRHQKNVFYDSFYIYDNELQQSDSTWKCKDDKKFQKNLHEYIPEFYDAPFMSLLNNWEEWKYYIKFQVWIQYHDAQNITTTPTCSFDWWLDAKAETDSSGNWILTKNAYSTINEIKQSINKNHTKPPNIDDSYLQISEEVKEWRQEKNLW